MLNNNLKNLNLTNPSKEGSAAVNTILDSVANKYWQNKVRSAWTHRYFMSPIENQMLQSCFERTLVYPLDEYKHSSHPVLGALNDFANEDAATQIENLKRNKFVTLSIGDSVDKKLRANHNCLLLDSSREDFRVATARPNLLTPHVVCDDRTYNCVNGSQKCNFEAQHAFAVHSLYDVRIIDLCDIFARHRLLTLTSYMYFTTTLYEGGLADPYPFFKVTHDNGKSKFYMNDESIIYTHNTELWRAWHTVTGAYCDGFNIIFEVVRSYGPLRIIKIARVRQNIITNVSRCVPLTRIFGNCCLVPDMYSAVKVDYRVTQQDLRHFVVPQDIVNAIMGYVQRAADEGYKWPEIATYWSGLIRRIRIGSDTIQEPFLCSENDSYRILVSLFLLGALQRQDRTKSISSAFKYIKEHADMGIIKGLIYTKLQRFMMWYSRSASSWQRNHDLKLVHDDMAESEFGFWFNDFHVRPIIDLEVNDIYNFSDYDWRQLWGQEKVECEGKPRIPGRYGALNMDDDDDVDSFSDSDSLDSMSSHSHTETPIVPSAPIETVVSREAVVPSAPVEPVLVDISTPPTVPKRMNALKRAYTKLKIFVGKKEPLVVNGTGSGLPVLDRDAVGSNSANANNGGLNNAIDEINDIIGPINNDISDAASNLIKFHDVNINTQTSLRFETVEAAEASVASVSVVAQPVQPDPEHLIIQVKQPKKVRFSNKVNVIDGSVVKSSVVEASKPMVSTNANNLKSSDDKGIPLESYLSQFTPTFEYNQYYKSKNRFKLHAGCKITLDGVSYAVGNELKPLDRDILKSYCDQFFDYPFPETFLGGHCAIRSIHDCLIRTGMTDISPRLFIIYCSGLLTNYIGNHQELSHDLIEKYIMHGEYMGSNISNIIIDAIACNCSLNIFIKTFNKPGRNVVGYGEGNDCYVYATQPKNLITLYHTVNNDGGHFSSKPPGGAITKYEAILADIDPKRWSRVLDLSCAPGWVTNHLRSRGFTVFAAYYKPGVKLKNNLRNKVDFSYDDLSELFAHLHDRGLVFDLVINDIGTAVNSEKYIDYANERIIPFLSDNAILITKTFANPHSLWSMRNWINIELPYCSPDNSERIFKCYHQRGYSVDNFYKWYDKDNWNRKITTHVIPSSDINGFADKFFAGKLGDVNLPDYRPNIIPTGQENFVIEAITGYASSSKTTDAINNYKNAVFIAPSSTLRDRLVNRGVVCFTPHLFFGDTSKNKFNNHSKYDTIIVDECFQFDYRYFVMLNQVYPGHRIVVLGDVHQTPPCEISGPVVTLEAFGVRNNMVDVYSIPRDICHILNVKHGFKIRTKSNVDKGLFSFRGSDGIDHFRGRDVPVITFNQASAERLRNMKINASTISTYTGSRAPMVVLYVDSSSIMSDFLARPKYIYTAMTRASSQLLIVDDGDSLSHYYNTAITPVFRLEDIHGIHLSHNIALPSSSGMLPRPVDALHQDKCSLTVATTIVSDYMQPINDPQGLFVNVSTRDVHPVSSGVLTVNKDMLMDHNKPHKVYRLSQSKFAKHQMSSNTLEAINTLNKRYSKRYQSNDKRLTEYTFNELLNGLCRAIYGNPSKVRQLKKDLHMSTEFVQKRQAEYYEKLNIKLKNPDVLKEIDSIVSLPEERLHFFNKRQSKFDPSVGFDTSPKVGQGVAATSKRINVLFCGWARALLDRIRHLLEKNKRDILLATHGSEQELNAKFLKMKRKHGIIDNYTCNDFSEWDASFRNPFVQLTAYLLKASGCPANIVDEFTTFRESWVMQYQTIWGIATLSGKEKQFSGNPFTIFENTIGNMALCFSIFDYVNFKFALFKGDDSAVACDYCLMTEKASDILSYTGHGLKLHNSPIGEFAGWFLTDRGLFPDVLRHVSKFLDKLYYDEDHFKEVVQSLQCRCDAVRNSDQLFAGAAMCAAYYNNYAREECSTRSLSDEDMQHLFYFMKSSRSINFKSLEEVDMRTLKVDNRGDFISK